MARGGEYLDTDKAAQTANSLGTSQNQKTARQTQGSEPMRSLALVLLTLTTGYCSVTKYEDVVRQRDKAIAQLQDQKEQTQEVLDEAQRLAKGNDELARQNARIRKGCDI